MGCRSLVHAAAIAAAALSSAALALPLVVSSPGCLACDSDVCESRLVVVVREPERAALAPGLWEFELVIDGTPLHATCEIGPDSRSADCDTDEVDIAPIISDDPDNPFTWFHAELVRGDVEDDLPDVVDVTIVHDGMVIVDERLVPDYELEKPERCDPDCVSDVVELFTDRG